MIHVNIEQQGYNQYEVFLTTPHTLSNVFRFGGNFVKLVEQSHWRDSTSLTMQQPQNEWLNLSREINNMAGSIAMTVFGAFDVSRVGKIDSVWFNKKHQDS